MTITKGDLTIEVTNDCDIQVDGDHIKISPKVFHVSVAANQSPGETVRAIGEFLKLKEPAQPEGQQFVDATNLSTIWRRKNQRSWPNHHIDFSTGKFVADEVTKC